MTRFVKILLLAVALGTTLAIVAMRLSQTRDHAPSHSAPDLSSTYASVMSSGVLRCGYVVYPPGSYKDPNTGKLSGIFVDTVELAAKNLGLTVRWAEEVGWGSMVEALESNRFDVLCTQVWANATRARRVAFSTPLFFSGIGMFVRTDDHRFDQNISSINSDTVRIATIDGEMSDIIAQQDFPQARRISLPQLSDNAQLLLNVVEAKADVTFVEPFVADQFLLSHSGTVRNLVPNRPIRVFPNTMMMKRGQVEFQQMLDTALLELINAGEITRLFRKYGIYEGSFYEVAFPYRMTSGQE